MRVGDHPRIRGEHRVDRPDVPQAAGSSPHTRGARRGPGPPRGPGRIIPAYAGSTSRKPPRRGRRWDHPRIRGEHLDDVYSVLAVVGSTPHTRGAPSVLSVELTRCPDHPRIRGEHPSGARCAARAPGSSPHTRGAPKGVQERPHRRRIIPAYAGSTRVWAPSVDSMTDHPRIRGEH